MILILIRHGESDHNVNGVFDSDIESTVFLTLNGIDQIISASNGVVEHLDGRHHTKVDRIFCSPLFRTIQSARIFKDHIKGSGLYRDDRFCIDYRLREIGMGDFNGKKVEDYPYDEWDFTNNNKFGGESTNDIYNRVVDFYKNLNDFRTNVVISHGEPIRQLIRHTTGKDIKPEKGKPIYIQTFDGSFDI